MDLYHLPGINIDFEHMYKRNARGFTCFIRELKAQLEPRGCLLFVDVIAPDGDENWSGCYEYWQLGMATDYMVLMAYDFTSIGSDTPGSGAPYYWVERSVNKLINRENIPADKIILSMPLFIRLWNVDKETGLALDNIDLVISMIKENICTNIANVLINLMCGIGVFIFILIVIKIVLKILDIVDYFTYTPLTGIKRNL